MVLRNKHYHLAALLLLFGLMLFEMFLGVVGRMSLWVAALCVIWTAVAGLVVGRIDIYSVEAPEESGEESGEIINL